MLRWKRAKRTPAAGQREADKALGRAEERLERAADETHEILEAATRLRRLGEHNDFAARIRQAMGGTQ